MKKPLLLVALIFFASSLSAQYVTLTHVKFIDWLKTNGYSQCFNGNNFDTTCAAVVTDTSLYISGIVGGGPALDINGIQYFDNLKTLKVTNQASLTFLPRLPASLKRLYITENSITSLSVLPPLLEVLEIDKEDMTTLPALPATLKRLKCTNGKLASLPSLPSSLEYLDCYNNVNISSLPALPSTLTYISCGSNKITSLPALPAALAKLYCGGNPLSSLPPLPAGLIALACYSTDMTVLPVLPSSLKSLDCSSNDLLSLPVLPSGLTGLGCTGCKLTSLPALPAMLKGLSCANNLLTSLPAIPDSLETLTCNDNQLTTLPALPETLHQIWCYNNKLTSLTNLPSELNILVIRDNPDLKCLPPWREMKTLPGQGTFLPYVVISNTGITCFPNAVNLYAYIDSFVVCDLVNKNGCQVSWNTRGDVKFDSDADCATQPVSDIPLFMTKILLSDMAGNVKEQQYWGNSFSFDVDTGTYKISIDTAGYPFDVICPAGNEYIAHITKADSMDFGAHFRVACKPGFDLGTRGVMAGSRFRPGSTIMAKVFAGGVSRTYGNIKCNLTGLSGTVTMTVTGPVTITSALSNDTATSTINGNVVTWTVNDFSLVDFEKTFKVDLKIDNGAHARDQICFDVDITPEAGDLNISNNHLSRCYSVRASYDPNMIEVDPLDELPYPYNEWLTYTIHFQNTGNDVAEFIKVQDTLDGNIDANSFQLLGYSVPPLVQIRDNKVEFSFLNINLPDSTSDNEGSKGFVQFRVKTKNGLTKADTIAGTASIYFDFNTPVKTNTVKNYFGLNTGDNSVKSQNIKIYPNPVSDFVTVVLPQPCERCTLTVTDMLGRVVKNDVLSGTQSKVDLSRLAKGIYYLKINTATEINSVKIIKQ